MQSRDFIIWLKGFSEACEGLTASPKQWEKIKEALNDVQDYNDYGDLDEEVDDWYGQSQDLKTPISGSSGAITNTVWNDKMGCWHYINYPEGFGYYHNNENKKQQLND